MMKKRLSKKIWYGSDVDSEGNPVLPPLAIDSDDLEGLHYGELYLHIADDKLSLWTRTLTDQVKQIGGSGSGDGELWQLKQTDAGEPYLFSPFDVAVQRGLTSFVDGGALNLPSIYDGLPIDGDTLYWVLDENGKKVMLKAAGGGGGVADSVHWDNIDGKPDFSQYVTNDSLLRYLPLSGGTMTGKITLPVGIGMPSLDWGENGSLGGIWVSSTGIFQIIAESEFRVLTNVDGVSTRQFGISNAGNMGVTGTLLVGKGGYLTNSQFKFYVYDGDAFIDGMLAIDGNVNPNIPSMYNIGDSSKRFACVYADSVDVGGVKISLLQDGVLLIDGNLAVTGGITSYVDGGDLDLPSIYDGLPIDGDTLYWVLDENGKKVMLKSKGGDEEGFEPSTIMDALRVDETNLKVMNGVLTFVGTTGGLDETAVKTIIEDYKYVKADTLNIWSGSSSISKVGTITSGTWKGSKITNDFLANKSISIAGQSVLLGGSIDSSSLKTALGLNNTLTMDAVDVYISSLQNQINGLWKRNWFDDLHSAMLMADVASVSELYGDNIKVSSLRIGDCVLSYDSKSNALTIKREDGTAMNVLVTGGLTSYSTEV